MNEQITTSAKLPTFLIIGVQKAGTTSIYNYLKQHPQVYLSPIKEVHFFGKNWEVTDRSDRNSNDSKYIDSFEKYCQLFAAATDEIALGEVSPNYLFRSRAAATDIKSKLPDVKLIAVLRNPIDRAYSDYLMQVRDAKEKTIDLAEQIERKADTSYTILKGFYYEQLQHFFAEFDRDRIKVYLYEDLCRNSLQVMQDMYRFIGVDPEFSPDVSDKAQTAKIPKNTSINNLLQRKNPLRNTIAKVLKIFLPEEKRQAIRLNLINLNSKTKTSEKLELETRQKLLDLYREDILKLQDLLQRDLSAWLKNPES